MRDAAVTPLIPSHLQDNYDRLIPLDQFALQTSLNHSTSKPCHLYTAGRIGLITSLLVLIFPVDARRWSYKSFLLLDNICGKNRICIEITKMTKFSRICAEKTNLSNKIRFCISGNMRLFRCNFTILHMLFIFSFLPFLCKFGFFRKCCQVTKRKYSIFE